MGEKYAPGVEEKYEVSCAILAPGVGCTIVESGRIFLNVRYLVQIKHYFFVQFSLHISYLLKELPFRVICRNFFMPPPQKKNGFHVGGGGLFITLWRLKTSWK